MIKIDKYNNSIVFKIKVQPRSSKDEIAGIQANALKIKVTAPPVRGAANKSCLKILSKQLKVNNSQVKIIGGEFSKVKTVKVTGNIQDLMQKMKNFSQMPTDKPR